MKIQPLTQLADIGSATMDLATYLPEEESKSSYSFYFYFIGNKFFINKIREIVHREASQLQSLKNGQNRRHKVKLFLLHYIAGPIWYQSEAKGDVERCQGKNGRLRQKEGRVSKMEVGMASEERRRMWW